MKKGLVMEGGAMRGMYTAGVTDVLMENNIKFDGAIGVSAGAAFGCNYKSNQPGRAIRYNVRFCKDRRYAGLKNLIMTGNLYSEDFCYGVVPLELDVFDSEAFRNSPMEFYVTCTDVLTGNPVYHKLTNGDLEDITWIRASASMPLASRVVEIGEYQLLDGGTADSIPLKYFESIGYDKNVVILTQPENFVKKKNKFLPLMKILLSKYPNLIKSVATRHYRYNETLEYIKEQKSKNKIFVIQPKEPLNIGSVERNPEELMRVYELGRRDAIACLLELKKFLDEEV